METQISEEEEKNRAPPLLPPVFPLLLFLTHISLFRSRAPHPSFSSPPLPLLCLAHISRIRIFNNPFNYFEFRKRFSPLPSLPLRCMKVPLVIPPCPLDIPPQKPFLLLLRFTSEGDIFGRKYAKWRDDGGKEGRERKGCESYAAAVVVKVFFGSTRLDGLRSLGRTVTDLNGRRGGKNFKTRSLSFPGHRLRREEGKPQHVAFFHLPSFSNFMGSGCGVRRGFIPSGVVRGRELKKLLTSFADRDSPLHSDFFGEETVGGESPYFIYRLPQQFFPPAAHPTAQQRLHSLVSSSCREKEVCPTSTYNVGTPPSTPDP